MKKYYEAYDERYKTAHAHGVSWLSMECSPIVMDTIRKYELPTTCPMLEIGCGEGRDSRAVLENGFDLLATDISPEAIRYCKSAFPGFENHFAVLDCLSGKLSMKFDFIFSVAVVHMLVLDEDRQRFYRFIRQHLTEDGLALICTMGDGTAEMQSDIHKAFDLQERPHAAGPMQVAGTSCRMVSFEHFMKEIDANGLAVVEKGLTSALPDFNSLMYAIVK